MSLSGVAAPGLAPMISGDTIVAVSSAVGAASRMIVRISGPDAPGLSHAFGVRAIYPPGSAFRESLSFCGLSVPAWVYRFAAPKSYTGDDLIEFHIPGNPVLAQMLVQELMRLGARSAEPGEFTARAYFNGRIDLTEAEGVAATIAAGSEQELSAARQLLGGELARRLMPLMDLVADTLALLEVGIDFSEEDVTFLAADEVRRRVRGVTESLEKLLSESSRFERIAHEPQVVLVGRPNAGKSTLLNALSGFERAVVSPIAGTTRDALSAQVALRRGIVRVIDVAGIEDAMVDELPSRTDVNADIDWKMRQHALRAVETADVVVLVHDGADPRPILDLPRLATLIVESKQDLQPAQHARADRMLCAELRVSAMTGSGMETLRHRLDLLCFGETSAGSALALNLRHVQAIGEARAALGRVFDQLATGRIELLALDLREALDCLGNVLGKVTPDDLLGRIFAGFCIGK